MVKIPLWRYLAVGCPNCKAQPLEQCETGKVWPERHYPIYNYCLSRRKVVKRWFLSLDINQQMSEDKS